MMKAPNNYNVEVKARSRKYSKFRTCLSKAEAESYIAAYLRYSWVDRVRITKTTDTVVKVFSKDC